MSDRQLAPTVHPGTRPELVRTVMLLLAAASAVAVHGPRALAASGLPHVMPTDLGGFVLGAVCGVLAIATLVLPWHGRRSRGQHLRRSGRRVDTRWSAAALAVTGATICCNSVDVMPPWGTWSSYAAVAALLVVSGFASASSGSRAGRWVATTAGAWFVLHVGALVVPGSAVVQQSAMLFAAVSLVLTATHATLGISGTTYWCTLAGHGRRSSQRSRRLRSTRSSS